MNNYFNLTIEVKPNQLNNINLIEEIPTDILKLLINSTLLKQTFNNPFSSTKYDNEKQQLEKYLKLVKDGKATVNYKQSNIKYGRVFPKNSLGLFSIRREIRHTLARDHYIDIDIENCHPVLLYQICEHNNIKCKYLKKYIDNRSEILNETMNIYKVSKDQAKQLFIQLLYFGTFESWLSNHNIENKEPQKFIKKFKDELNTIGEIIVANNPKLLKAIQKIKEEQNITNYNLKGSLCSYFLQEYESRILETIYLYLLEKKLIINYNCVLCADGLMIEKANYKPELLTEFKELIKDKMGFDLNFTQKEMNQGYSIEDINAAQITNNNLDGKATEYIKTCNEGSFKDISNLIKDHFINNIVYSCKTFYTFNENNKLWQSIDNNFIKNEITEILKANLDREIEPFINSTNEGASEVIASYKKANKLIGNPDNCNKILVYLHPYIKIENFEEKLNRSCDYLLPHNCLPHKNCLI